MPTDTRAISLPRVSCTVIQPSCQGVVFRQFPGDLYRMRFRRQPAGVCRLAHVLEAVSVRDDEAIVFHGHPTVQYLLHRAFRAVEAMGLPVGLRVRRYIC